MLRFDMYALGLAEIESARETPAAVRSRPGQSPAVRASAQHSEKDNQQPTVVVGPDGRHLLGYSASTEVRRISGPHNLVHLSLEQGPPD